MKITLSLPHRDISPNSRKHWRSKAGKTKEHRARAKHATRYTLGYVHGDISPIFSTYSLAFYLPDKLKRDDDNLASSCKAYRDGIADALGIDDHNLRMDSAPTMQLDRDNPRVEFTLKSSKSCRLEPINQLIEQWERRIMTVRKAQNDASGAGDFLTETRCRTKASVIQSHITELKRAILDIKNHD